jgi:hypothetical protein
MLAAFASQIQVPETQRGQNLGALAIDAAKIFVPAHKHVDVGVNCEREDGIVFLIPNERNPRFSIFSVE